MREELDEQWRGVLACHEATHVMKQLGFSPYMKFVACTGDKIRFSSRETRKFLGDVEKHRKLSLMNSDDLGRRIVYDEVNATVFGYFTGGYITEHSEKLKVHFPDVFYDFDTYINELADIHEQFKVAVKGASVSTNETKADGAKANANRSRSKVYSRKDAAAVINAVISDSMRFGEYA